MRLLDPIAESAALREKGLTERAWVQFKRAKLEHEMELQRIAAAERQEKARRQHELNVLKQQRMNMQTLVQSTATNSANMMRQMLHYLREETGAAAGARAGAGAGGGGDARRDTGT